MSEEQLKAFLETVKGDASLKKQLESAEDFGSVEVIARKLGFKIASDDLKNAQLTLSDKDLEGMAGGAITDHNTDPNTCSWNWKGETFCEGGTC